MKIESVLARYSATCRACSATLRHEATVSPDDHPELPLGDAIELACHEHLEAEGWTAGMCGFCSGLLLIGNTESPCTTPS